MNNPTALLLENEPVIAADLSTLLRDLGWQVLWAADGCEALALCALHVPDLAVLHFKQPDGADGMSLARVLRANFPVKVFLVTGARQQDLEAAPDFEADCTTLFKPFTRWQFKTMLQHIQQRPP